MFVVTVGTDDFTRVIGTAHSVVKAEKMLKQYMKKELNANFPYDCSLIPIGSNGWATEGTMLGGWSPTNGVWCIG